MALQWNAKTSQLSNGYEYALEESLDLAVYLKRLQHEIAFLQKRNEWLEEVVALLQESGVDLSEEGFPIWNEDGTITRD